MTTIDSVARKLAASVPTPFYLYDGDAVHRRVREFADAFSWSDGYRQFFAVKALPNPRIISLLHGVGCGMDCSSPVELELVKRCGVPGKDVVFTSNNTTREEFLQASEMGALITCDAPELAGVASGCVDKSAVVSMRYRPERHGSGNVLIGEVEDSKFGSEIGGLVQGYEILKSAGFSRFGIHAMIVSNELSTDAFGASASALFSAARHVEREVGVLFEYANIGGGIGVPYQQGERFPGVAAFGDAVQRAYAEHIGGDRSNVLPVHTECGRAVTGPFGVLVTRVVNRKKSNRCFVGVDASMSNLMRPGMYGAYHRIDNLDAGASRGMEVVDVVGSLCENNDKFAIGREMPKAEIGDLLVVRDVGAHAHSMGFQYNGRLRSAEYLALGQSVERVRRAETADDYFATAVWE